MGMEAVQECQTVMSNLDSGSLRNKDFPDTVEAVEVRLGEPGRQDGTDSLGQVPAARHCGGKKTEWRFRF